MINFPDFTSYGYRAIHVLGRNTAGFRTTYEAVCLASNQPAIVKHFEAVPRNSDDWNTLEKMYAEEIQALQGLKHPNIPRFIESLQIDDQSRCIVLEYKNGQTLAEPRSFSPDEIKNIAVSLLEILIYLQDQVPSVKHRDIKPENILVEEIDKQLNVYLVDFGFARIGDGEASTMSSMIKGTFGFMAPEQFQNKSLTNASDLYSLGATLICLVTGIKSHRIDNLKDSGNRINFKELVPGFSLPFIKWLERMVEPDPSHRHPDAKTALATLNPLYVRRIPQADISESILEFRATKLGEKLTQTIMIANPVPETLLEAWLEVGAHMSDPPHTPDSHLWISFSPSRFSSNSCEAGITLDTSKLMADRTYKRQIILHSNTLEEIVYIDILVKTAPLPLKRERFPYVDLVKIFLISSTMVCVLCTISYFIISCTSAYDASLPLLR